MNLRNRWILIALVVAGAGYLLLPTVRWILLTREAAAADAAAAEAIRREAIGLGLDLQGGIHLALEIDAARFRRDLLARAARSLREALERKGVALLSVRSTAEGVEIVAPASTEMAKVKEETERIDAMGTPEATPDPEAPDRLRIVVPVDAGRLDEKVREATGRALEIIRNRVDAFGVSEPVIQQVGDRRIVVELPGVTDPGRAKSLVGRTALLAFHVVRDDVKVAEVVRSIDAATHAGILSKIQTVPRADPPAYYVYAEDEPEVRAALSSPASVDALPPDVRFAWGSSEDRGARKIFPLYLIGAEAEMTAEHLESAHVGYDRFGKPAIYFAFDDEGARQFGDLSGVNVGKRLAIVLDGRVQSAPTIRERITRSGEITGRFTPEEAKDLAIVLEAGALPAPLQFLYERAVGPSLGRDAIRRGSTATIIVFLLVALFMAVRYKAAGLIADVGLLLTLVLLLASITGFGAVLTLPGIAGIALTLGMAVDANVLIFERIREELRTGKTFRVALEAGFDRAYSAIVDANLTTIIAALALYYWGTGPIRGFAVTLTAGIVASMFTAVYVTRTILESLLARGASRIPL